MNSPTMVMEKNAAVRKLEEYEQAARNNPKAFRDIDKGLIDAYRSLAKGKRLVDVNEALKHGGLNIAGIPKLAIARAHRHDVSWRPGREIKKGWGSGRYHIETTGKQGGGVYDYSANRGAWSQRIGDDRVAWQLPDDTFDREKIQTRDFLALTPLIPLPLRPRFKLENYFLLWEASWTPAPPVDPYLLRPVAGSLMEIVAEWELSAVEVAAVRGAMRNS
jgi:hypothetical protein